MLLITPRFFSIHLLRVFATVKKPMSNPIPIPVHSLGVVPDADIEAMPLGALVAAENWIYEDGELHVRQGFTAFGNDINQRPTNLIQYLHNDGTLRTVQATTVGWWKYASGTWTDISGTALTGSPAEPTVFRVFQKGGATHLLGTNGADTMKKWDGNAATYSNVGGSPARCRTMMVVFDRFIIGHLLSGGTISGLAVDVSAFQDFDAGWGSVLTAIVGAETEGNIVAMRELGALTGAIYKEDAIVDAIGQDGAAPFRFVTSKTRIDGPASALAVTGPREGFHLIFTKNGAIMSWDGVSYGPLGGSEGRKFQTHIVKTCNLGSIGRSFSVYDSDKNHAWFFYPEKGTSDPKIGIVINLNNLSMWPFRLGFAVSAAGKITTSTGLTIGDLTGQIGGITQTLGELGTANALQRIVVGEVGGQAAENVGTTDLGTAIPISYQTGRYSLGRGHRYKTVKKIQHRFNKTPLTQNISVQIGVSDHGGTEVLSDAKTVDIGQTGPYNTGHRHTGKFLSMRLSGSATQPVIYRGSYVDAVERGER